MRGLAATAIAARLNAGFPDAGVNRSKVESWRRGAALPPVALIPHIARITDMRDPTAPPDAPFDPLYILRRLGLVDEAPTNSSFIDAAYRLQKLQLKLESAQHEIVASGRAAGAARIVQAALRTRLFAVAVWPAVEGPSKHRLHVADRIDIQRTDRAPISRDDVWAQPELKEALRAAYAVPGRRQPRWSPENETHVSTWSITHVGAPSGPLVSRPHPGLPSIAFSATTLDSWVHDVASLTSLVLGYGLTTTRDLAMETSGLPSSQTRPQDRAEIHEQFLLRPPERRVWSHHGPMTSGHGAFAAAGGLADPRLVHVRLVESEGLLRRSIVDRGVDEATAALWFDDRRTGIHDMELVRDASRVIRLDVEDHTRNTALRWTQVLWGVRTVISELERRGMLRADLTELHNNLRTREPGVAPAVYSWLAEHDCPLVR